MLTDDADNDDEDGSVILLAHQQMYYNYLQWAEQSDKHERNMKKYNELRENMNAKNDPQSSTLQDTFANNK